MSETETAEELILNLRSSFLPELLCMLPMPLYPFVIEAVLIWRNLGRTHGGFDWPKQRAILVLLELLKILGILANCSSLHLFGASEDKIQAAASVWSLKCRRFMD